jgi:signal transduction histidine kinase
LEEIQNENLKLLIVEDEVDLAEIIVEAILLNKSFSKNNIFVAHDGERAIEIFKEINPDLIVTDLQMPKLGGQGVIEFIRSVSREPKIIAMSGNATVKIASQLFPFNVSEFVQKPFDVKYLCQIVSKVKSQIIIKKENEMLAKRVNQSEKRSTIGLLATGIAAHEINNPNTFLKGNLEIILKYSEKYKNISLSQTSEKELQEVFKEIEESAKSALGGSDRIAQFTTALLHTSKNSGSIHSSLQIKSIINDSLVLTQYRTKKHIVELVIPDMLRAIKGNSTELSQVFINLIINAVDAVEEKVSHDNSGIIKIEVEDNEEKRIQKIHFIDNGVGISKDLILKIFEPFFSTKPTNKGTGLGLSICKGIIEGHGGALSASNNDKVGSCFTVTLRWA